ncbi:MAG: phosphoribosyltransferase [Thermomicrobiales bacterium]
MSRIFRNRYDAGRQLAELLTSHASDPALLVLALPRGGVPVAFEVARALHAPLDVLLVRKLGVPGQQELAMGAIASGGVRILNETVVTSLRIPPATIEEVAANEEAELARRERQYRDARPWPNLHGRTVMLVDDGLATGATMHAAAIAVRRQEPARLIVAAPVAALETCNALRAVVDEIVCAITPERFHAVGLWYDDFEQTTDDEVRELLARAGQAMQPGTIVK